MVNREPSIFAYDVDIYDDMKIMQDLVNEQIIDRKAVSEIIEANITDIQTEHISKENKIFSPNTEKY